MIAGTGFTDRVLADEDVRLLLARACDGLELDGKCVLVIIPDGTRTAPLPLMFRALYEQLGHRVERLDYLIALGTHPPMSEEAIQHLVGVGAEERARDYPNVHVYNHHWSDPQALETIGMISAAEAERLTE
ncbi:MAG: DUF2088 domain-containing protein, partial [Ktedonobacteraceae bacterium]|nr:DUF2088 domain-containing protein [Ktedonobacteraceae bacterium]